MTEPNPTATAAEAPAPSLATLETLAAWAREVQSAFMDRYKKYLSDAPAPTRKAVLRIQLETLDSSIREVQGALNHAHRSTQMMTALDAALVAFRAGNEQALSGLRDSVSGRPTPYTSPATASQHSRELGLVIKQIRKGTPARLEKASTALKEIDGVLAAVASTPEDAIARIDQLEKELADTNATWQARITALEARFEKVATGSAKAPKPAPKRRSTRAKKAAPKAKTPPLA